MAPVKSLQSISFQFRSGLGIEGEIIIFCQEKAHEQLEPVAGLNSGQVISRC